MPFFELENADPTRRYVWANGAQAHLPGGPGWFELLGYVVETVQPGGVRPRGIRTLKDGDEIKVGDLLLMSVDLEEHNAQVAEAQRRADERERQMIKNRGMPDRLRGIHGRNKYFTATSDLSPLELDRRGA